MLKRWSSLLLALVLCGSLCVSGGLCLTVSASSLDDYFGDGWSDGLDDALDDITGAEDGSSGAGDVGAVTFEPVTESDLVNNLLLKNTAATLAVSDSGFLSTFNGLRVRLSASRTDPGYVIYPDSNNPYFFPYSDDMLEQYPYVVSQLFSSNGYIQYIFSSSPMYFTMRESDGAFQIASSQMNGGSDPLIVHRYSLSDGSVTVRGTYSSYNFSGDSTKYLQSNYTPLFTTLVPADRVVLSDLERFGATSVSGTFLSSAFIDNSTDDLSLFTRNYSVPVRQQLSLSYELTDSYVDLIYPASDFGITSETEENRIVFDGSILLDFGFACVNTDLSSVYLSDLVVDSMSFLVDGEPQGAYSLRYDRAVPLSSSFTLFDILDVPNPPTSSAGSFNTVAVPVSSSTQTIGFRFYLSGDRDGIYSPDFPLYGARYNLEFMSWLHLKTRPSTYLVYVADNGEIVDRIDQLQGDIGQVQTSINQVQSNVNQVQNELTGVNDSVQALPGQIGDTVSGIFLPNTDNAEADMGRWEELLSRKLGPIYQVYSLVDLTVTNIRDSVSGDAHQFHFPGVSVPIQGRHYQIIQEQDVSLDNDLMSVLRPLLGAIVCIVSTLAVFNILVNLVKSLISGENIAQWIRGNAVESQSDFRSKRR